MKHKRYSETIVAQDSGQRDKLAALLESLRHSATILEVSIADEERRTGKHDRSHYAYSIEARAWLSRLSNLKATIEVLEQRLA
jgi:hypothetical protein